MKVCWVWKLASFTRYFYRIPWCVPAWGWPEFLATLRCFVTGSIVKGEYPAIFASEVKNHLGIKYSVPVNKGRFAIEIAIKSLGLTKTDEVVLPAYICASVLDAVINSGASPVFADIGDDLHVTPETIKAVITPRTRCVIVPHLFGNVAPIDQIEAQLKGTDIVLIDDAAQSFGARCAGRLVGTFGTFGIVSCGPGKSLAGPAGGLLLTNDDELYLRASAFVTEYEKSGDVCSRTISFWFWRKFRRYTLPFRILLDRIHSKEKRFNLECCTMSNLDGAIAHLQFRSLHVNAMNRRINSQRFIAMLDGFSGRHIANLSKDTMSLKLVLILPSRQGASSLIIKDLALAGIEAQTGYQPLHHNEEVSEVEILPITQNLWERVVCIPVETTFQGVLSKTFKL